MAATAASNALRRGSCLCRSVKFAITGPPARNIVCNCVNCQKASGSAFLTNQLYKASQYQVESGADLIKTYIDKDTDSSATLERKFCSNCGSNLNIRNVTNPALKDNIVVCAGTLDDNFKDYFPQSELFKHRRHTWVAEIKKASSKSKM